MSEMSISDPKQAVSNNNLKEEPSIAPDSQANQVMDDEEEEKHDRQDSHLQLKVETGNKRTFAEFKKDSDSPRNLNNPETQMISTGGPKPTLISQNTRGVKRQKLELKQ